MNPLVERLGWTLIHSLWEGAVVWIGLQVTLRVLSRSSANIRHLVACVALVLTIVAPWVTYLRIDPGLQAGPSLATGVTSEITPMTIGATMNVAPTRALSSISWSAVAMKRISHLLPWVVLFWILGFVWSAARLTLGWRATRRLLHAPRQHLCAAIEQQCRDLARRLGIKRMIQIGESALVEVPSVVSWLKPVILVPAGAFAGLTPAQVEGLIAHELAHVVRHDFVVNLLQSFCEVVFFYNPAVWMINRIIRNEREHACDDIAVKLVGDPHGYAVALAHLEETRHPELVLAASGQGRLLKRIRRLVAPAAGRGPRFLGATWVVLAGAALYVATLFLMPGLSSRAKAAQPSQSAEAASVSHIELFRIGIGDRLHVVVFDGATPKDRLDSLLRCDAEGNLLVPGIGSVHVLDLTLAQAGKVMEGAYRGPFDLKNPNITLMVSDYAPREVTVTGQVRNPSRYLMPIEGSCTPLDLVLRAGGFTDIADGNAVRIVTVLPDGSTQISIVDIEKVIEGKATTPADTKAATLQLKPGDIVFVPTTSKQSGEAMQAVPNLTGMTALEAAPTRPPPVTGAESHRLIQPGRIDFEAMAALQCSPPGLVVTSNGSIPIDIHSPVDLQTYQQILRSEKLRQRVIASYSPAELELLQRPGAYAKAATGSDIFGTTGSESDTANLVIYIFSRHPNPAAAALIANRYASQFLVTLHETVATTDDYALKFLQQRAEHLQRESAVASKAFEDFATEHGTDTATTDRATVAKLNLLKQQAGAAKLNYETLLVRLKETKNVTGRIKIPIRQIVTASAPND